MVCVITETNTVEKVLCRGACGISSPWRRMKYGLGVI